MYAGSKPLRALKANKSQVKSVRNERGRVMTLVCVIRSLFLAAVFRESYSLCITFRSCVKKRKGLEMLKEKWIKRVDCLGSCTVRYGLAHAVFFKG